MEPIPSRGSEVRGGCDDDLRHRQAGGRGGWDSLPGAQRSPSVSEKTRRRVLDVIEELEYTPSSIARRLSLVLSELRHASGEAPERVLPLQLVRRDTTGPP